MIDVVQLREANERLKPLRRLMDDLQKVTEMLAQVEGEHHDRVMVVSQYDAKIKQMQTELADLEAKLEAAKAETEADLAGMQASRHLAAAELVVFKEKVLADRQALQAQYEAEETRMKEEHVQFVTALRESRRVVQEDYDRVTEALKLLRQQITV